MKIGENKIIISKAVTEPYNVNIIAKYALPFNKSWCPGRIERAVS